MREYEYLFKKGLKAGLRPHHKNPRGSQFLTECLNARVGEKGLLRYLPFPDVLTELQDTWSYMDHGIVQDDLISEPIGATLGGVIDFSTPTVNLASGRADFHKNTTELPGWLEYGGAVASITSGQTDPDGGTSAYRITTTGGSNVSKYYMNLGSAYAKPYSAQIWIKNNSANNMTIEWNLRTGHSDRQVTIPAGSGWTYVHWDNSVPTAGWAIALGFSTLLAGQSLDVTAWHPQVEPDTECHAFHDGITDYSPASSVWSSIFSSDNLEVTFGDNWYYWSYGYQDLESVAYAGVREEKETSYGIISLRPLNGYGVKLTSFDMAKWTNALTSDPSLYPTQYIISDLVTDAVLAELYDIEMDGAAAGHYSHTFDLLSYNGLRLTFGPSFYYSCVDNISYDLVPSE